MLQSKLAVSVNSTVPAALTVGYTANRAADTCSLFGIIPLNSMAQVALGKSRTSMTAVPVVVLNAVNVDTPIATCNSIRMPL